ncbi:hypothetical protein AMOR_09740 [Anaeromyxobacter oryzae]|uniref:Uncharacterized protein n=1 Tax=Anaeromyxobacter oryzae TaxID=2918170 RepID=A0ABM7WR75_9BACT|nr:hypothetical protein AMOR_09740 [Anaeromyxobacter oryzae]
MRARSGEPNRSRRAVDTSPALSRIGRRARARAPLSQRSTRAERRERRSNPGATQRADSRASGCLVYFVTYVPGLNRLRHCARFAGRTRRCQSGRTDRECPDFPEGAADLRAAHRRTPPDAPHRREAVRGEGCRGQGRALLLASGGEHRGDPRGRARPPPRPGQEAEGPGREAAAREAAVETGPHPGGGEAGGVGAGRRLLPVGSRERRRLRLAPPSRRRAPSAGCGRTANLLAARKIFGDAWMDRYAPARKATAATGRRDAGSAGARSEVPAAALTGPT